MSEWRDKAACRQHERPDMWFPDSKEDRRDTAVEAKQLCYFECKMRRECGNWALDNGMQHGIFGGYDLEVDAEWKALHKYLDRPLPARSKQRGRMQQTIECADCGTKVQTRRTDMVRCQRCAQGLVSADPVKEHVAKLHDAGMLYMEIAAAAGVQSVLKLKRQQYCDKDTARKILAVNIPVVA